LTRIYTSDRTPTAPPKIDLHRKLRPAALENTAHAAVVRLVHLEVLNNLLPIIRVLIANNLKDSCKTALGTRWQLLCASLLLLYMRPHATIYVSSHCQICDLILLCMCPHTTIYVPSYYYVCVLMLQLCCRCVVPRGFGHVSTQVAPQPAQHPVRRRSVASSRRRRLCQRLSSAGGGRRAAAAGAPVGKARRMVERVAGARAVARIRACLPAPCCCL